MFPQGAIVMKIDKLLVSSAMLTALCEKKSVDNLKLLEPFVWVCISDIIEPGEIIPKERVLEMLDQRFAFQKMPMAVLDKILSRIAGSTPSIKKVQVSGCDTTHQFKLIKKPTSAVDKFLVQAERAKKDTDDVIGALIRWFQDNRPGQSPSNENAQKFLGSFFETNGYDILFDPEELRGATIGNTDVTNYQIGRFILDAQENNSDLFRKITDIAQGMMLASAIYVDTTSASKHVARHRLSELNVFLDTTLLLQALGFKTELQKQAADALLKLLQDNGANLYVFPNHLIEIEEILKAFKDRDAHDTRSKQSLEMFEEAGLTSIEIDREIRNLKKSLEKIGVFPAPPIAYTDSDGHLLPESSRYIDYIGLREHLIKRIPQYGKHPAMLDNDVDAISAIMIERASVSYSEIESCPAIFVTTNYKLVRESNYFLHYRPYTMYITPTISDMDLTTILWVKYAMTTRDDIPRLRLVEHARAAIDASGSVMSAFNSVAKRMIEKGTLTEDEAADFRYSAFARAEIAAYCGGDPEKLDDTSIIAVRERVKAKYATQEKARADKATFAATQAGREASAAKEEVSARSKALTNLQTGIKESITELRKDADTNASKTARVLARIIQVIVITLILAFMAICGWATAKEGFSASPSVSGIIAVGTTVVGAVLLWLPALNWAKRIYTAIFCKLFDRLYSRNLKKVQSQINRLEALSKANDADSQQ